MSTSIYRRVTPRRRGLLHSSQIWLASDHLLVVSSVRYLERYQRFAFADIHAIVTGDGPDRIGWQVAAVAASIVWTLSLLLVDSPFGKFFFAVTGVPAIILAIRDIARGPRCWCVLNTAVSSELLAAVSRRRVADRFLAAVRPHIEEAQANLPVIEAVAAPPALPFMNPPIVDAPTPPALVSKRNFVGEALFALLLVDAVIVWWALRGNATNAAAFLPTVYMAEVALALVVLLHRNSKFAGPTAALALLSVIFTVVDMFAVSGAAAWLTFANAARQGASKDALNSLWMSPAGTVRFAATWRIAAGLLGLIACQLDRREARS